MRNLVGAVEWIVGVATLSCVVMLFTLEGRPMAIGAPEVDGAEIYRSHCAICHGGKGLGGTGPPLARFVVAVYPEVDDQIEVVSGGGRGMPAYSSQLSAIEIEAVVMFTREGL